MAWIANAWMQNPVGAEFNYHTMRMELTSFSAFILNPGAKVKFVHAVAAGYVAGSEFVLAISSYYLLKKRDMGFARRSFTIAAAFGLASALSVIVLGDESGYELGEVQKVKLSSIEAAWETEKPPASFTAVGWPNQKEQRTDYVKRIPYVMGNIATRSLIEPVLGLQDLMDGQKIRIRNGMTAYALLQKFRGGEDTPQNRESFDFVIKYLGYGLLLKKYTPNVTDATEAQSDAATRDTIPTVGIIFWAFRIMVGCGVIMLLVYAAAFSGF